MKIVALLSESKMLFSDFDTIKIDADRDDLYDIKDKLLPILAKMAYKNLWHDKEAHEKKYGEKSDDEDAYNFDFSESALSDEIERVTELMAEKLKEVSSSDIKSLIKSIEKEFQEKLDEAK